VVKGGCQEGEGESGGKRQRQGDALPDEEDPEAGRLVDMAEVPVIVQVASALLDQCSHGVSRPEGARAGLASGTDHEVHREERAEDGADDADERVEDGDRTARG